VREQYNAVRASITFLILGGIKFKYFGLNIVPDRGQNAEKFRGHYGDDPEREQEDRPRNLGNRGLRGQHGNPSGAI
jgi:hypothetical protein